MNNSKKKCRAALVFTILVLACLPVLAQVIAETPSEAYHVNPDTPLGFRDGRPAFAASAAGDGTFVVTWWTGYPATPDVEPVELYFQRFAANGSPLTERESVAVNGHTQHVSSDADGDFVVLWEQEEEHYGRSFSAAGEALTDAFPVTEPSALANHDDGFVVVSLETEGFLNLVVAQRYSQSGLALGDPITVNTQLADPDGQPKIATLPGGQFVVVWIRDAVNGDEDRVAMRTFSTDGLPLSDETVVDLHPDLQQKDPLVRALPNGDFVVAWTTVDPSINRENFVVAQRFHADGSPPDQAVTIPEQSNADERAVGLAVADDGEFLLTWARHNRLFVSVDEYEYTFGRYFSPSSETRGGIFRLPGSEVHGDGQGNYIVVFRPTLFSRDFYIRRLAANDRAGKVRFSKRQYFIAENNVHPATAEIYRTDGADGDISVDLMTLAGDAVPGEDYIENVNRITFLENDSWDVVKATAALLIDDEIPESRESFSVSLFNPSGTRIFGTTTRELFIYDEDFNSPELMPSPLGDELVVDFPLGIYHYETVAISPAGRIAVVALQEPRQPGGDFPTVYAAIYEPGATTPTVRRIPGLANQQSPAIAWNNQEQLLVTWFAPEAFQGQWLDHEGNLLNAFNRSAGCIPRPCPSDGPILLAPGADDDIHAIWERSTNDFQHSRLRPAVGSHRPLSFSPGESRQIAFDRKGNFVVAWWTLERLMSVRYRSSRPQPFGNEKVLLQNANRNPTQPLDLALADDGILTVMRLANGSRLMTSRFGTNDRLLSQSPQLSQYALGFPSCPTMAPVGKKHFNIFWQQFPSLTIPPQDGDGTGIFMRRFNGAWGPIGGESQVNTTVLGDQTCPVADGNAAGESVVLYTTDGGRDRLLLQRFGPSYCVPDEDTLCLSNNRFQVELEWNDGRGNSGKGFAAPLLTGQTGYFWFFDENNAEVIVKALDGRNVNGEYWVFYGSLSDVEYTMTVTDTMTGRIQQYHNPLGTFASGNDNAAFPGDDLGLPRPTPPLPTEAPAEDNGPCVPGPETLCLGGGRFEVTVDFFRSADPRADAATARPLTNDSGAFWFFGPRNLELVVKVLDGRAINNHFWVFYGALSDVKYRIRVRDLETGRVKEYNNPRGRAASVGDAAAFPAR